MHWHTVFEPYSINRYFLFLGEDFISTMEKPTIALIAPPEERVPPYMYGGTERILSFLADGLVARGHHVILYASADSQTSAELVPIIESPLRMMREAADNEQRLRLRADSLRVALKDIYHRRHDIDIIHNHTSPEPYAEYTWRDEYNAPIPWLHTLHGRLDYPDLQQWVPRLTDASYISISHSQRLLMPEANYFRNIYNGTPIPGLPVCEQPNDDLVFVGRMSPEKNPKGAIDIARASGRNLRFITKTDPADKEWYDATIARYERDSDLMFMGELDTDDRDEAMNKCAALVGPIEWHEPFGLFVIEALATGLPVIVSGRGGPTETMVDGETGFVVPPNPDGTANVRVMAEKVDEISRISRQRCQDHIQANFTTDIMVDNYSQAYIDRIAA